MATPTPRFRQRDAATLQPNMGDGRGPKGVFHLTPRALSNVSAQAVEPGKEGSTTVPMARMRTRCLQWKMSAARRRTEALGRRIVDVKGVTGQADGGEFAEYSGMKGHGITVGMHLPATTGYTGLGWKTLTYVTSLAMERSLTGGANISVAAPKGGASVGPRIRVVE
jgi:hypothetical protein